MILIAHSPGVGVNSRLHRLAAGHESRHPAAASAVAAGANPRASRRQPRAVASWWPTARFRKTNASTRDLVGDVIEDSDVGAD